MRAPGTARPVPDRRRVGVVLGAVLLAWGALPASGVQEGPPASQEDSTPPETVEGEAPEAEGAGAAPEYHEPEDRERLLSAWMGTGLAERVELGVTSAGGRELLVVQIGAPGARPLAERPTLLLVGGLDGRSIAGSEAVVELVDRFLGAPERMPARVAFLAVPWANPDGLEPQPGRGSGEGLNARATDDDHDGRVDEDGPDDLDGDGQVLEMLIEDPRGPWVRASDGRFLRPAEEGEAPRYRCVQEGRDDDGDGLYNEDGAGGVALERNFPLGWIGPWEGEASGPWPLSEPCSRALADLILSRRVVGALFFQSNHGRLATPGARSGGRIPGMAETLPLVGDEPAFRALTDLFTRSTGRPVQEPLRISEARGGEAPGSPVDWAYVARGVLAMEVGVWGPEVQSRGSVEAASQVREGGFLRRDEGEADPRDQVLGADRAWARWLDDTRGGIGFVDWQPVDLGEGRVALVGGWEPRTCINPPADALARALFGLDDFVLGFAQGLARLEVEVRAVERDGLVVRLRARVRNGGSLPSGAGPRDPRRAGRLELQLLEGLSLIAGEAAVGFEPLPGGGASPEFEWLLTAPEGAVVRLRASAPFCDEVVREVRLP